MKVKYLLPAMALPLMVACTQDEVLEQVDLNAQKTERPVVGKVSFVTEGDIDSRFNYYTAQWEKGDKFNLFMMDDALPAEFEEWVDENGNANNTWFMNQARWNEMYRISNYYQTNLPFEYNGEKWVNDDAAVEGNYFAVVAAENQKGHLDKLTNRRDVWLYINPVQSLNYDKANSLSIGGLLDNQFFLGYTQLYRNQELNSENNELQLPIQMRPVLANVDLAIHNTSTMKFKVEKIVMNRLDGSPMPTLAYVRPANNKPEDFGMRLDDGDKHFANQWNMATEDNMNRFFNRYGNVKFEGAKYEWESKSEYNGETPAFHHPYIQEQVFDACGNEGLNEYWSLDSWTRTAARSVVEYSYPGQFGLTPYQCKGDMAKLAYEYVFEFNNGKGIELENDEWVRAIITLPHDMYLREYAVTVYGQQYDTARQRWEEGVILPDFAGSFVLPVEGTSATENDGEFTLQNIDLTSERSYIEADIKFSDFKVGKKRLVQTANSEDLLKHLKSYYGENAVADQNKNTFFYVETMGDFVISNELVDYVQKLYNNYGINKGSKSMIYFTRTTGVDGQGQLVFPADLKNDHAIDLFYYSKNVNILNEGTQVIEKPIIFDYDESKRELMKSMIASNWSNYMGIFNDGIDVLDKIEPAVANSVYGGVKTITNAGTLTIKTLIDTQKTTSEYDPAIINMDGATLILDGALLVGGCAERDETYVHNDGTIKMLHSGIQGTLDNHDATIVDVCKDDKLSESEVEHLHNRASDDCSTCGEKAAVVTIMKDATLVIYDGTNYAKGKIDNNGTLTIDDELTNIGVINNLGTVNGDVSNNKNGVINNGNETTHAFLKGRMENSGIINAYNGTIETLVNSKSGVLNVWKAEGNSVRVNKQESKGEIVFKGVAAKHIDNGSRDERVFEVQESQKNISSQDVLDMMKVTETTTLRTAYDIVLTHHSKLTNEAANYASKYVTLFEAKKNKVNLYGESDGAIVEYKSPFKLMVITVENNAQLHIENAKIVVDDVETASRPRVHVATGSDLIRAKDNKRFDNVVYHTAIK